MVKKHIRNYWSTELLVTFEDKSSAKFINTAGLAIGKPHPTWSALKRTPCNTRKEVTKVGMLTGAYMLQTAKCKFSAGEESPICKCCGIDPKDIDHVLL